MKLISFNCTIEVSKDENGYPNSYYVSVDERGVCVSHPYVAQSPEQVMFVTQLIHDFVTQTINFNNRIDGFNRDMCLEQYAPQPPIAMETEEKLSEVSSDVSTTSSEVEVLRGGSDVVDSSQEVSTESEEVLEAIETASDKA